MQFALHFCKLDMQHIQATMHDNTCVQIYTSYQIYKYKYFPVVSEQPTGIATVKN